MRALLSFGVVAVAIAMASPVSAQMCGPGQSTTGQGGMMMCGGNTTGQAQQSTPGAAPSTPRAQGVMANCPCCRNMAGMMGGGQSGGGANMPGHSMPGMELPKPQ